MFDMWRGMDASKDREKADVEKALFRNEITTGDSFSFTAVKSKHLFKQECIFSGKKNIL